jgi:hypothetical protein
MMTSDQARAQFEIDEAEQGEVVAAMMFAAQRTPWLYLWATGRDADKRQRYHEEEEWPHRRVLIR